MDQLAHYAEQLSEIIRQHIPGNLMPGTLPAAAIVILVFGVGISVLGAKLARWLITVAFAVGGLIGGMKLGGFADLSPIATAMIGAAAFGAVGFVMHRLWVGMFTGLFLASVAFGVLSTQMVLPHLDGFAEQQRAARIAMVQTEVTEFEPGQVGDAVHASSERLVDVGKSFTNYVMERQPSLRKYGVITVIAFGAFGLLLGMFLCRLTLILFTAAFGTSLIATGMAMLGKDVHVDMLQLCQDRPEMSALALVAFFLFSVVLQTMLTRREPSGGKSAPQPAASA